MGGNHERSCSALNGSGREERNEDSCSFETITLNPEKSFGFEATRNYSLTIEAERLRAPTEVKLDGKQFPEIVTVAEYRKS